MKIIVKALVCLGLLSGAATAEVAQTMRQWWVECGPRGYCWAEVNGFSADNQAITVRLQRSEAENAPILVILTPERTPVAGQVATFDVPGVVGGISGTIGAVNDGGFTFSEPVNSALIKGFRLGTEMQIGIDFGDGRVVYTLPLAGAVDSLTIFDIAQQRLGRTDAAVAIGGQPVDSWSDIFPSEGEETGGEDMGGLVEDTATTASGDDDQGDAHMEEGPNGSWFDLVYEPGDLPDEVMFSAHREVDCANVIQSMAEVGAGVRRDQMGRMWYMVPCDIGKANVSYFVVLNDPASGVDYEQLQFELPITHNKPNRDKVLNLWYDNDRDLLIVTRFGNVNRNCGAYEEHRWNATDRFLELQLYREKKSCGGPEQRPQDWALAWTIDEMGQ